MAVIASMLCILAIIEYGKSYAWMVFGVTSVLSLILLATKTPAIMYALFFGYYPILKERFEQRSSIVCWALKELVFNAALVIIFALLKPLLLGDVKIPLMLYAIAFVLCEVVFVVYDIALTRLISLYVYKIRSRLKIK